MHKMHEVRTLADGLTALLLLLYVNHLVHADDIAMLQKATFKRTNS